MSMQRSMQRTMRRTLLAMALVALGANSTALAQSGTETLIDVEGSINNDMGTPSVDVYTFTVNTGDVVTVDIDGPSFDQLDSVLSVVDPTGTKRHENLIQQDTDPADPGSGCTKSSLPTCATYDSYLQFKVDIKGNWTVSVTGNPNAGFGGYNLLVTREEAPLPPGEPDYMTINIDIKPDNKQKTTPIKMGERHIRVALLSKKGFDPFKIEEDSLRFGPTGTESSFVRCAKRGKDRNRDRKPDRVCRFDIAKTTFTLANTKGKVKGKTLDGKAFQGDADVKVLAQKHHHKHHHGKHHDDDDDDD